MFLSSRHSRSTPWLKYIPLLLLPVILLVGAMYVLGFVRITPPISAKAVDAVTGKPIPGMTVCLQAQDLGRHLLRSKMSRTGDSGRFLFSPSIYMDYSWPGGDTGLELLIRRYRLLQRAETMLISLI